MTSDFVPWWSTSFQQGEADAVADAVRNRHVSQGPIVAEFEARMAEVLEVPHVVATTSGSSALALSLLAHGVGPGDEVIVPNRTWVATAHAVLLLGAQVRLVDVMAARPIIDAELIESAITPKTKAIMPVHLNGRAADMPSINQLAQDRGLVVIEDAAQALGSLLGGVALGTMSTAGCFSLSTAKIIASGQGGFVATRSESEYRKLVSLRTHGVGDVVNAQWKLAGFNFRFTDVLASIALVQLGLLKQRIERIREIRTQYAEAISRLAPTRIRMIDENFSEDEVGPYIEVMVEDRDAFVDFMAEHEVEVRPFYPSLNRAQYVGSAGEFPNSEPFERHGVFLPSGPSLTDDQIQRVVSLLSRYGPKVTRDG